MSRHEPPWPAVQRELLIEALRTVVSHFWRDEQRHFEEFVAQGGEPQKHVFPSLQLLRDWVQLDDATWKPNRAIGLKIVKKMEADK